MIDPAELGGRSEQDGNVVSTSYSGSCTTAIDESGKKRKSCADGLGRLTKVFEDPAGLNYETDYSYDALNNLLQVVQKGGTTDTSQWRNRSFTYDSLSRLLSATNPESGTITYAYDPDGNVVTKTDARGITTTMAYDQLNRVTQKSYSDSTPLVTFTYDITSTNGVTIQNPIGRLVLAQSFGSNYNYIIHEVYDPMGRPKVDLRWMQPRSALGICCAYVLSTNYNFLGEVTADSNEFFTVSQQYDSAARLNQITSSWNDAQHPANLLTVDPTAGYTPAGAISKMTYGNGLVETSAYNNRLQPTNMRTYNPANNADVLNLSFGFTDPAGHNNGNVQSFISTANQIFMRSYTYDSLNRLSSMSSPADVTVCYGLLWSYDAFGNRLSQYTNPSGGGTCFSPQTPVNPNNRLQAPYQYDAAGNMTQDASHSYTYDAENRLIQVDGGSTATYVYDPEGQRLQKTTGGVTTVYLRDPGGNVVAETDGGDTLLRAGYAYAGGELMAEYENNTTYFIHIDHLGSTRVMSAMDGSVADSMDYLPYGEQILGGSGTTHKFTGKERDAESGLDNFDARYLGSSLGRFMSPDPLAGHTEDPQTLNRYAYVRNNPLNLTDPTGLDFYLSCQKASNTCQKDAAGNLVQGATTTTTDANGITTSSFMATVVTSASLQDPNSGNTAVVNANGVEITTANGTAQGIFINGTPSANIQGDPKAAGWSDFVFNINGSDEKKGTLTSGSATYKGSRDQGDVIAALNKMGAFTYGPEKLFGNYHHPGELNFRFSSGGHPNLFDYGPSPHFTLPQDPRATVPVGPGYATGFHVDSHTGPRHSACAEKGWGCTN